MPFRTHVLPFLLATAGLLTACGAEDGGQPMAQNLSRSTAEVKSALTKVGETTSMQVEGAKERLTVLGEATEKTVSATADTLEAFGNKVKALTDGEPAPE